MKYQTFDEWLAAQDSRQFGLQALRQHGDPTGLYRAQLAAAFEAGRQVANPPGTNQPATQAVDGPVDGPGEWPEIDI